MIATETQSKHNKLDKIIRRKCKPSNYDKQDIESESSKTLGLYQYSSRKARYEIYFQVYKLLSLDGNIENEGDLGYIEAFDCTWLISTGSKPMKIVLFWFLYSG